MRRLLPESLRVSGTFRPSVDDFEVEEVPLYPTSGQGDHLWVTIEKRGLNTRDAVLRFVRAFGVKDADVGTAGMKDRHAVTRQQISVLARTDAPLASLEAPDLRVLEVTRHNHKLRTGHLAGNRFRCRILGGSGSAESAQAALAVLSRRGLPNYYGEQRFGVSGDTAALGRAVLARGPRVAGSPWKARLVVSALQSSVFNAVLDARLDAGQLDAALVGDVLQKTITHGLFTCADAAVDGPRVESFEVSATGPIPGPRMRLPTPGTLPAAWEDAAMLAHELTLADFGRAGALAEGTRRAVRARVEGTSVAVEGEDLWVTFQLPAGGYATVLLGELLVAPPDPSEGPSEAEPQPEG